MKFLFIRMRFCTGEQGIQGETLTMPPQAIQELQYSGDLLDLPVMTMSLFSTTSRGVFATLHFVNLSHAAVFLSKTVSTL